MPQLWPQICSPETECWGSALSSQPPFPPLYKWASYPNPPHEDAVSIR